MIRRKVNCVDVQLPDAVMFGQTEVMSGAASMHQALVVSCVKKKMWVRSFWVNRGIVKTIIYKCGFGGSTPSWMNSKVKS